MPTTPTALAARIAVIDQATDDLINLLARLHETYGDPGNRSAVEGNFTLARQRALAIREALDVDPVAHRDLLDRFAAALGQPPGRSADDLLVAARGGRP